MRSQRFLFGAAVGLLAVAVYSNALPNAFVYDDHDLVRMNASIRDASRVGSLFASDLFRGSSNYYRPLPGLIFTAVYRAAGPSPWAFRLVNLLLHALASVLVFRLIHDLLRERPAEETPHVAAAALGGAALFAVHPVHVEAVAWISGIMDVACTAFALLAFDLYRRADATPRGRVRLAGGLVAFLLAMLAKEPAVVLPALLLLHDGIGLGPRRTGLRPALVRLLPWLATLGLYLGLRAAALGALVPHGRPSGSPLVAIDLFGRYVRTIFWPADLSVGHFAPPPDGWTSPRALVALALLLGTAALAGFGWRRHRALLFGLALFLLTLAPALAISGLGPRMSKLFSDRYLYFPSVGWALVVAAALSLAATRSRRGRRLVWLAASLAVLVFSALTVRQNRVWRSDVALWKDAVGKYPADGTNQFEFGRALLAAGDAAAARRAFDRAAVVDPGLLAFHVRQGRALLQAAKPLQAMLEFERALMLDPGSFEALLGAADAGNAAGWNDLAASRYRAAIALQPGSAAARNGFGFLLARMGELDAAIEQFEAAIRVAPQDPVPLRNLATALERRGDRARAAELRERAAALGSR